MCVGVCRSWYCVVPLWSLSCELIVLYMYSIGLGIPRLGLDGGKNGRK